MSESLTAQEIFVVGAAIFAATFMAVSLIAAIVDTHLSARRNRRRRR